MNKNITLKKFLNGADGIIQYKLDNKIGMGIYKIVDGVTVSKSVNIEFDNLKDICGEFEIDHLDGEDE